MHKLGSERFGDQPRATEPGLEAGSRVFIFGTLGVTASCSLDFFWSARRESCLRADANASHSSSGSGSPFPAGGCRPPATPLLPAAISKPKTLVEKPGGWNQGWRSKSSDGDERPRGETSSQSHHHPSKPMRTHIARDRQSGRRCGSPSMGLRGAPVTCPRSGVLQDPLQSVKPPARRWREGGVLQR